MKVIFSVFIFMASTVCSAQGLCPDLSGEYEGAKLVQVDCTSLELTQYRPDGDLVDYIQLDNVYRELTSMPQFDTASTFNPFQLIFNSKDKEGKHVRIFLFSLNKDNDLLTQRIVLDGEGNVVTSDGFVDYRILPRQ